MSKKKLDLNTLPPEVIEHIQQLERMREDFVANVSHELRTPLTVIQGYLESLLEQDFEELKKWRKTFSQMYQHSVRMEHLIADLLLLSRLETEQPDVAATSKVNVAAMLVDICQDARDISGNRRHQITLHADESLTLTGVKKELKSLFSNIIINAVNYTPAHGRIIVRWFKSNDEAIFSVEDTGIGIAAEYIPRITERFYRVDKARSRDSGGTGLGLAIAKHVLMRHQGELKVESEPDCGSTFTCVFR